MAPGGYNTTPKVSETAGRITMKFLPHVKLNKEAWKLTFTGL